MRWPYCGPHTNGVRIGAAPFFVSGCPTCERKKLAGVVTGEEGRPPTLQQIRPWGGRARRRVSGPC